MSAHPASAKINNPRGLSIEQAARRLGRHPATVRSWIRNGAPVEALGRSAKGHGSRVCPEQLARWYANRRLPAVQAQADRREMDELAALLLDALKRSSSEAGLPLHHLLSLTEEQAAGLFFLLWKYLHLRICEQWPDDEKLPDAAQRLFRIASETARVG